ncbi:MAG: hypothetical protein V4615_05785 [Bacteroidota bacterium]
MQEITKVGESRPTYTQPVNGNLSKNKVTAGTTLTPEFKLKLAQEAAALNMTLSALIELRLLNFKETKSSNNAVSVTEKEKGLVDKVSELQKKLALFETPLLISIYEVLKGETHVLTKADGQELTIKVSAPADAYTILLHSFQVTTQKS